MFIMYKNFLQKLLIICVLVSGVLISSKPCHAIKEIYVIGTEIGERMGGWTHPSRVTLNRVNLIKVEESRTAEGRLCSRWALEGPMPNA